MQPLKLFVPLTKIDVEKREVWGRAVQEVPDRAGEIFDFDTSKPLFEAWSDGISKATDGKSLGNIRAMHGNVAAGKMIAMTADDAAKAYDIGTKIVDDNEWQKCLEGVYTGFSIGGTYEKKWKDPTDPRLTRYTAAPIEISLVDLPCIPTATYTMVKADGATETKPFQRLAVLKTLLADETLSIGDTIGLMAEYLPAAEVEKLSAAPETTMGQVREALKKFASEAPVDTAPATPVKKSIYSIGTLADVLCSVRYLADDAQWEAAYEQDGSAVPQQLRDWLKQGVAILTAMTAEETAEMLAAVEPEPLVLAARADLQKVTSEKAELEKRADAAVAKVAELTASKATLSGEKATLEKTVTTLTEEKTALTAKVTALEAEPAPPKGVTRVVVDKAAETLTADPTHEPLEKIDPNSPTFSLDVMKAALQKPIAGRAMPARP